MSYFTDNVHERIMRIPPHQNTLRCDYEDEIIKQKRKKEENSPCVSCPYNRNPCIGHCLKDILKEGE